ncbi:hypothetical protein kuro4_00870 [Gelria sp. Kuro-4]|nr:hypothetical protein kuro4_00870 [Gelria sp. Kuro-4]
MNYDLWPLATVTLALFLIWAEIRWKQERRKYIEQIIGLRTSLEREKEHNNERRRRSGHDAGMVR